MGEGEGIWPPPLVLSSQSGVLLGWSLPSVLSAAGFFLCLLAVAVVAGALAVGEVEFVAAFTDRGDVVGFG